jgi:flavodoxin
MRRFLLITISAIIALIASEMSAKSLVVYYSWSSTHNTAALAKEIAKQTGADITVLEPATAYPTDFKECVKQARYEHENSIFPAFKALSVNVKKYDTIYVGFPNWCGTMPMFVAKWVKSVNWKGKTAIPFMTHGSGGRQNCFTDFAKYATGAKIKDGLSIEGTKAHNASENVTKWIENVVKK